MRGRYIVRTWQRCSHRGQRAATPRRPHLLFADAARTTPAAVITAVSPQPVGPACDTCHLRGQCHSCKLTHGRDWTYTVLQPLAGYEAVY